MKRFFCISVFLFACYVQADIVPTINYTAQAESDFKRNGKIYSVLDSAVNGDVDILSGYYNSYPRYCGGTIIASPAFSDLSMSDHSIQIAALFNPWYGIECWGRGVVEGTLAVEETDILTAGQAVELQIDYASTNTGTENCYLNSGVMIYSDDFSVFRLVYHSTDFNVESYTVSLNVGQTYNFYIWQDMGKPSAPLSGHNVDFAVASVAADFSVVPEPFTIGILAFGAVLSRNKIRC